MAPHCGPETGPPGKRRKLRKGTFSCTECKRRKVRCQFAAGRSTCASCERHKTRCVGQEYGSPSPPPVPEAESQQLQQQKKKEEYRAVQARLGQMEVLVEALVRQRTGGQVRELLDEDNGGEDDGPVSGTAFGHVVDDAEVEGEKAVTRSESRASASRISLAPGPLEHGRLNRQLQSLLPPTADAMRIMSSGALFILKRYRAFVLHAAAAGEGGPVRAASLQKRDAAHPVMLARELMQLAVCLQMMSTNAAANGPSPSSSSSSLSSAAETADRYFEVACRLVTSQDGMVGSLEGLESLMLQAFYLANAGQLRSAWLCLRRALGIAQIMGLPPGGPAYPDPDPEETPRNKSEAERQLGLQMIYARLLFSERFLSLMLGLPSCVAETTEGSADAQSGRDGDGDGERLSSRAAVQLERRHSVIIARIIARNARLNRRAGSGQQGAAVFYDDFWETQDIDGAFQQAAATLPTRWWAVPDLTRADRTWPQRVDDIARLMAQAKHHHLVVLLHLPYVAERRPRGEDRDHQQGLAPPACPAAFDCTYSKLSALGAAREVLARFRAFQRGARQVARCCSLDFEAFAASAALLLAHLDGHGRGRASVVHHMRAADRARVEDAVDCMDELSRMNKEIRAGAGSALLRRLLAMEAAAAEGTARYAVWLEEGTLGQGDGHMEAEGVRQRLSVPYFGTVHIEEL